MTQYSNVKISDLIIGMEKIVLSDEDKLNIEKQTNDLKKENAILSHLWKARTNQPYKNIITDEKLQSVFYNKNVNEIKHTEKDLIIHKASKNDSIETEAELKKLVTQIVGHDNNLKKIYSTEEKENHYKNFERSKIINEKVEVADFEESKTNIKKELDILEKEKQNKILIMNIIRPKSEVQNIVFSNMRSSTVINVSSQIKKPVNATPMIIKFK